MKYANMLATILVLALAIIAGDENAKGDFVFGEPENLGSVVNSAHDEYTIDLSSDALALVFSGGPYSWQPGGKGGDDIWMAARATTDEPFAAPVNLTGINTSHHEFSPTLSADQLSIFFSSDRPGGRGNFDLWVATRPSKSAPFTNPVNLGSPVNSSSPDFSPCLPADGLSLYFNSSRSGGSGQCDLHVTTRATINSPWSTPQNLGPRINSYRPDGLPRISDDDLTLFFVSDKPGGYGKNDIYVVTRASTSEPWAMQTPVNLGPAINTPYEDTSISIWEDRSIMFLASARPGGVGGIDIWQAPIIPVVDFDGDGIVNLKDFSKFALYWHQNESSVDIAPATLGDGKVDYRDLAIFAGHFRLGGRPSQASYPNPSDSATDVSITAVLSWTAGYGAESHVVHFGKTDPPALVSTQTETTYGSLIMSKGMTYYWRIDEVNSWGKTVGQTWSFTTETGGGR